MKSERAAIAANLASMLIFGTIGIVKHYIMLPSGVIAFARGVIGALFLVLVMLVTKRRFDFAAVSKNFVKLLASGAMLGFNWILLFEAYDYTSVPVATLCYYLAPTFVILVSPLIFKERLTASKLLCAIVSLIGMVLVSGIAGGNIGGKNPPLGILLGIGAAVLYASIVLCNKSVHGITPFDRTTAQLVISAVVLVPYLLIKGEFAAIDVSAPSFTRSALLLLVAGIIHTGVAYALYFGSLEKIRAQTAAIFSYVDPVTALILAAPILGEKLDAFGIIGAILIIGAALASELIPEKH